MKIIVLDDEAEMRFMLERYLSTQGMVVRTAADPKALMRLLTRESFDLLVLDISMPDEDGLSVCRRLREQGETLPILMLTARSDTVDRIVGLEMGADDYLAKPFEPRELVARIKAQIRARQFRNGGRNYQQQGDRAQFGEWDVSFDSVRLLRNDVEVGIKAAEHSLLCVLVRHANRPLGRDKLIALSREYGTDVSPRSIDVQILRLRRLIEDDYKNPKLIRTVWGVGYSFVPGHQYAALPET